MMCLFISALMLSLIILPLGETTGSIAGGSITQTTDGGAMVLWNNDPFYCDYHDDNIYFNVYQNGTCVVRNGTISNNFTGMKAEKFIRFKEIIYARALGNNTLFTISQQFEYFSGKQSTIDPNFPVKDTMDIICDIYHDDKISTSFNLSFLNPDRFAESFLYPPVRGCNEDTGLQIIRNNDYIGLWYKENPAIGRPDRIALFNLTTYKWRFLELPPGTVSFLQLGPDNYIHTIKNQRLWTRSYINEYNEKASVNIYNITYSKMSMDGRTVVNSTLIEPYARAFMFDVNNRGTIYISYVKQNETRFPKDKYFESGYFLRCINLTSNTNTSNSNTTNTSSTLNTTNPIEFPYNKSMEYGCGFDGPGNYHMYSQNPRSITLLTIDSGGKTIVSSDIPIYIRVRDWMIDDSGNLHLMGMGEQIRETRSYSVSALKYYVISPEGNILVNDTIGEIKDQICSGGSSSFLPAPSAPAVALAGLVAAFAFRKRRAHHTKITV